MQKLTHFTQTSWKAGISRVIITPDKPMWMAGYASRVRPSEGALHELWAKALVLEDSNGKQAVLVTIDVLGVPKRISDLIRDELHSRFGLSRSQIILNSSHTHSGPVLENALISIYPFDEDHSAQISEYSRLFITLIVSLVAKAFENIIPVNLYSQNGVARFQVNRRNNSEAVLDEQIELKGPNDYAVPVIKVESISGETLAIVFGYACHNTVLDIYKWSGDYAGFAQIELENEYPGSIAMFFQGAGGDQNPLPRRTVALAKQYGKTLAAAVGRVLEEEMNPLEGILKTNYSEIKLHLEKPPSEEELNNVVETSTSFEGRCAEHLLKRIRSGEFFDLTYDYPLQVWQLGNQPVISMGGEVVIEYTVKLKQIFGKDLFVMAYSNDLMGYIPSAVILQEGGYEGDSSQMVYGLPGKWKEGIEERILDEVVKLAEEAGVQKKVK